MFFAPAPRFRLYTRLSFYFQTCIEVLLFRTNKGTGVVELESEIANQASVKFALAMPTARMGIYLTLANLIKPGQSVLLSPLTIVDVVNMVICAGGKPVFVDVEPHTCNIDANLIESKIDHNTGAVLITHLHGLACDVQKLKEICDKHKVPLVEDAAQAFSSEINGKWMGSFGKAGIFSFGLYKNVTSFYGGMILTNDQELYKRIKETRDTYPVRLLPSFLAKVLFGLATDISTSPLPFSLFTYWFFRFGYLHHISKINDMVTVDRFPRRSNELPAEYKKRMLPIQARLIFKQLEDVKITNQKRIAAAHFYDEGLKGLSNVIRPPLRSDGSHIYTYYPIRVPDRHALMRFAMQKRRDFVLSHYHNTADLSIFEEFASDCPVARATSKELIYLPTYPSYGESEIKKSIKVIQDYFQNSPGSPSS